MFCFRRTLSRSFSSNYKPKNTIRIKTNVLDDVLMNPQAGVEWESVRKELIANERFVNSSNVDAFVIGTCSKERRLDIAKSYVDYMKSKSLNINDASAGKLLRLFYNHHQNEAMEDCEKISDEDEAEIVKLCDSLLEKYEIVEASLAENLIHGLCLTKNWMKSLDLLNQIRMTSSPNATTYSIIISKAFDEDHNELAWNLLSKMSNEQFMPKSATLLKVFKKFQRDDVETEKMLSLMSERSVMLPERTIEQYHEAFKATRECNIVRIKRNGHCPSCSNKLPNIKLNRQEFEKLSNNFFNDVMIRNDIFIKTHPAEVKNFMRFVDKTAPFDCVIDGLNVAFSHGAQQSSKMFARNVASVVRYFADRKQSCLVIGRKHMNKWDPDIMEFIRRNSSLFLAENISQDDPFLLYAALKSGPNTNIFSRDLMRGHSALLDSESRKLFRRWQQQHQYSLITTLQNEKILVEEPIAFELRAHKINSFWHVPFTAENLHFTYESFEMPSSWLCVKISDNS